MNQNPLTDDIFADLGNRARGFVIPPPVFEAMQGEFLAFDQDVGALTARFPILGRHLNPYGSMQGGMVAAAVDNTFGPLSMLVAPPNVTRRFWIKYSHPVTPDLGHILVHARLLAREGRWLHLKADVRDPRERLLARAQAEHWIVDDSAGW